MVPCCRVHQVGHEGLHGEGQDDGVGAGRTIVTILQEILHKRRYTGEAVAGEAEEEKV